MNNKVFWSLITQVGKSRAYMYLDTLGHTLRHLHVVLTAHVLLDISSQVVTGCTDGVVAHNTAK